MSDVGRSKKAVPKGKARKSSGGFFESGIFRDPVVRYMTYGAFGLVILFLATLLGALATGVMAPTGPRTVAERELQTASAQVKAGATGEAWATYIDALVATGDLGQARVALTQARASAPATAPVTDLDLSEARILSAENDFAGAVAMATKAMKAYQAQFEKAKAGGGDTAAKAFLADNYYASALVIAYADVKLGRFEDAIKAFDVYIKQHPTASDILIDRGNAKADMKDRAGAEKDFRAALKFVPYDEEAKAGLKRIGVSQ